jgi:hypothetical protein
MQGMRGPQYTEITKPAIIVGRNNIPVPPDEVELMAKIGSTDREIAEHFGITDSALRRNFADFLIKGRSELRQRLRQAQLRVAFDGNPTMLIWLGRNILAQNETPYNTHDQEPLPWNYEEIVEVGTAATQAIETINIEDHNETT